MKMISPVSESAYSKAVVAEYGTLLFISGQESIDQDGRLLAPGDFTGTLVEFTGSPMRKHIAIDGLTEHHFTRWLTLFRETLRDRERVAEATDHVGSKARTIAESLLTGIKLQRHGLSGSRIERKTFDV